jgi:thiol-disulfide isomerase/thioredoxin
MSQEPISPQTSLLVVCLCAEWCGVCREYRPRFDQLQAAFPLARFLWIDVEDEADLLHPLDVENFPTLLLAVASEPRFFGTLAPQVQTLERLIRMQLQDPGPRALTDPQVAQLVVRLRARSA